MSVICPTVLAANAHEFREQMENVEKFATRVQIDLKDGIFAPGESVKLDSIWFPGNIGTDLHLMYKNPDKYLSKLIGLKPHMVIVHAESNCDIPKFAADLRHKAIKTGIAVLQETKIQDISYLLPHVQHLLIFSGNLGHFGGKADLKLTKKITEAKKLHPYLEIGWDGGVSFENCEKLSKSGVDVLNVGGAIQKSELPQEAYATMVSRVETSKR
jgi:ribulose-phosphate 3-epimerase